MTERRRKQSSVAMLGLRGINGPQGGIETHVEALSTLLVQRGWAVKVLARRPYMQGGRRFWRGVDILPLWSPSDAKFETLVHSALAVGLMSLRRPDIVHIHGIGPALFAPFAKLAALKTVVTHHGYDYDREKWSAVARAVLRSGESNGMRFADEAVAVAHTAATELSGRFGRTVHYMPNGVFPSEPADPTLIAQFGIAPRRYVLHVSRIVPEKRQLDLIAAYGRIANPDFKLVLVGAADHPDGYDRAVRDAVAATPGVVMTGFRRGDELAALFANAGLFMLPSSHEGMPIALLEALSFGVPAMASDIEGNLAVGLPDARYHKVGDISAIAAGMASIMANPPSQAERLAQMDMIERSFGWEHVADAMSMLYASMLRRDKSGTPLQVRSAQSLSSRK